MEYTLEDQHHLLRLNFAPQHIVDGKVIPAAISTDDLKSRGYSLDSEVLVSIETLKERAESQAAKKPEDRKSPHISRFACSEARALKYDDTQAFNIYHSPVEEKTEEDIKANPAHVSLVCRDNTKGPSYYKKAKHILLPVLQNLITLSEYTNDFNKDSDSSTDAPLPETANLPHP